MRIQYISDLHLEFEDNKDAFIYIKDSDILVIAGDLGATGWIHGHSHEYLKRKINSIEFCRNSFGYPHEKLILNLMNLLQFNKIWIYYG